MSGRVLVAGVGNVFFRDDAFGVEVVRQLADCTLPDGVTVRDFDIRGMHLAYEIVSGYDTVLFVDAIAPRGGEAGTISVIEPDVSAGQGRSADAHSMELDNVFAFVRLLGGSNAKFVLVGCEPEDAGEGMGLTPAVAAAVRSAAEIVLELAGHFARSEATI